MFPLENQIGVFSFGDVGNRMVFLFFLFEFLGLAQRREIIPIVVTDFFFSFF